MCNILCGALNSGTALMPAAGYGARDDSSGAGVRHGGRGVIRGSHRQAAGHAVLRGALPNMPGTGRSYLGSPVPTAVLRGLRRVQGGVDVPSGKRLLPEQDAREMLYFRGCDFESFCLI